MTDRTTILVPASIVRVVRGALQVALCAALVLAPTVFGNLHRFGSFELLFVGCLLAGIWVVSSLVGVPLTYPRAWANLFLLGLLAVVFLQVIPLPFMNRIEGELLSGPASVVLTDQAPGPPPDHRLIMLPVGRYSLRPAATLGLLSLVSAAAALYWLTASAPAGRKALRWTTWAAILGPGLLAFWAVVWDFGAPVNLPEGVSSLTGPVLILGGDSFVPALLTGLPLALATALRLIGWMPRRPPGRRESRHGWLGRSATVWAVIAVLVAAAMALALGLSTVPRSCLVLCAALAVGFVLAGYVLAGPGARLGRRPLLVAAVLALVVVGAMGVGSALSRPGQTAMRGDEPVRSVIAAAAPYRAIFGVGSGAISPRRTFGDVGWPEAPGENVDTDGFLLVRAEIGWLGLGLGAAAIAALALHMMRGWWRSRAPWTRMVMMAGLGILAANGVYFRQDAAALLAPNLLVLAAALGVVAAWGRHGSGWRPGRAADVGRAHWPLVGATLGLMAALGVAETNMVSAGIADDDSIDFKFLHFGGFAFVCLLLCRATGPHATARRLGLQVFGAVAWATAMGAVVEVGQRHLTWGRTFAYTDMLIDGAGALLAGLAWYAMRRSQAEPPAGDLRAR